MHTHLHRLASVLIVAAGLLWGQPAWAAMMSHSDLASLVFESEVVIRAERGPAVQKSRYQRVHDYRVLEIIHGSGLSVGDTVTIDDTLYNAQAPVRPKKAVEVGSQAVLFLWRRPITVQSKKPREWFLASSGLRLVIDGKINRFEQWSNPGGFAPVPQGRDPEDLKGFPAKEGLNPQEFRDELDEAMARADTVKRLIAASRSSKRAAALLGLLGPPVKNVAFLGAPIQGFYRDKLAVAIMTTLASEDPILFLEAYARHDSRASLGWLRPALSTNWFDYALKTDLPLHQRRAAVHLASASSTRTADDINRLMTLLAAPHPEIRAAVLDFRFRDGERPADAPKRLLQRWDQERDPRVRYAIIAAATRWGATLPPHDDHTRNVAVIAERHHNVIVASYATLKARPGEIHHVVVKDKPSSAGVNVPVDMAIWQRSGPLGTAVWQIPAERTSEAGTWTVKFDFTELLVKVASKVVLTRRAPVPAGATEPKDAATAAASSNRSPKAPPAASVNAVSTAGQPTVRPPRGCGCDFSARSSLRHASYSTMSLLGLAAALAFRRRRRD